MTPPSDLLVPADKGKPIDQWVFPESLRQWIQTQRHRSRPANRWTQPHSPWFRPAAGDLFPANDHKDEAPIAPAPLDSSKWITLKRRLAWNTLSARTRFVTREGGFGSFRFHVSGMLGPNTIQVDYDLSRVPEVAKLTGQPISNVYEPPILGRLAENLLVDVNDNKLRLRTPAGSSQIELASDQVIVREASQPELRATRLHASNFEIDAGAGEVVIRGRQRVTLRRVADRVEIAIEKRGARPLSAQSGQASSPSGAAHLDARLKDFGGRLAGVDDRQTFAGTPAETGRRTPQKGRGRGGTLCRTRDQARLSARARAIREANSSPFRRAS